MIYLRLFSKDYIKNSPKEGVIIQKDIPYLRKLYNLNSEQIKNYYMKRTFSVRNTFFLSRVLEHIPVYLDTNIELYLDAIERKVTYLAKHFKVTSEIEKGIIHPGYFFGNGNSEIIININENFNPYYSTRHFRTVNPISIYKHNINDLNLLLPNGKETGSRTGLCSIGINFQLLALKYREFIRETNILDENLTKNQFVYRYVLNLLIPEITDHIFLNKLMDRFYGREEQEPKFKHVFKIYKPITQINHYIDDTLDVITNKNLHFINLLRNIKLLFKEDASELLELPDFAPTRQITWSMFISRLDHMLFLYDITKNKDKNRETLNDWKRLAIRMYNDKIIENSGLFDYSSELEIQEKIYKLKNL